jgi:hypothetical protein
MFGRRRVAVGRRDRRRQPPNYEERSRRDDPLLIRASMVIPDVSVQLEAGISALG